MNKGDYGLATADDNPFVDDRLLQDISASPELEESALCLILPQPGQMRDVFGVLSGASFSQGSLEGVDSMVTKVDVNRSGGYPEG